MISLADVAIALRLAMNLPDADPNAVPAVDLLPEDPAHNCHGDGQVDMADVAQVLRLALGLAPPPTSLPCRLISPIDGAQMALVPAGPFTMGSNEGDTDALPPHRVDLDAYYIDVTEVTNQQFARFVAQTGYVAEGNWRSRDKPGDELHPVVNVTWGDALAYTFWCGRRLPTEAEWEKAARGTDGRLWPWGNQFDPTRFNFGGRWHGTMPVGSFPAGTSPYGLVDMAGNACEWQNDWYDPNYYSVSPVHNPQGPAMGDSHVVRGGSWEANAAFGMSISRSKDLPHTRGPAIGFRCALSLNPEVDP